MNYQNLENEAKTYSDLFKLNQNFLFKLSNYYKETGKLGVQFAIKIKKYLDDIYMDILKQDRNTTYNKFLINFYNQKKNFIEKLKTFFTNIEKNFGDKLAEYEKYYKNKSKDILVKFNLLYKNLSENKSELDKWKNQYLTLCQNSSELEKKIISFQNQPDKKENLFKYKVQLMNNQELKDINKKNYYQEQTKLNKILESSELNYKNIISLIEKENIDQMKYVGNIINDSNQNFLTLTQDFIEHLKEIEKLKITLNAKRDWKDIKKAYSFSYEEGNNKEKRFLLEEFLDYDSFKNNEKLNHISNNNIQQSNSNNIVTYEENEIKYLRAKRIYNMGKLFFIDFDDLNEKEKEINKIIINLISDKKTINNDDFLKVIQYIENDDKNCITFMDILATHFCDTQFISIKNYDNFYNLINIIVVILNSAFDKKEIFDVCFLIIFVAENCGYLGDSKSTPYSFFFEILSSKTIFSSTNFWKDLIETKIEIFSQLDINKEYNKRMKNIMIKNNIFGNIFGKINNNMESELMLKQILKEKALIYFNEIFYSFLKHFTHFNFFKHEELLNIFSKKYKIDETMLKYFKSVIKSDNIFYEQKKIISKIKSREKKSENEILFNYTSEKNFKKIENKGIKCILFSLKYLNRSDYISILCLSKKYYKPIQNIIYKQFLLRKKNIEIKSHLNAWKILLGYNEIKNKHNYQKILELIKDKNSKIINENIIELDIGRTHIQKNKEENKIKLSNVLKSISYEFPEINYYQGMNQLAAFLLNISDYNEEEAFYIFAGIILNTKYCSIFENNLEKIRTLFYQYDRFLNLYIPEIYICFDKNSVNGGYFLSSWFITLFTNFFDDNEENNNAKTIMLIFDFFIFYGWKTFVKIGIILFRSIMKEILEKNTECLLPFLTGDIVKAEIINYKNTEQLRDELNDIKYKIKNELFDNIAEEFEIKKKIEFFKKGNKINSAF